jgi:hypothetical protein
MLLTMLKETATGLLIMVNHFQQVLPLKMLEPILVQTSLLS